MDRRLLIFLYVLAFILLREWLLPLMEFSKTGHIMSFLLFIALAFILALINPKLWISLTLKIVYIFSAVHFIFYGALLFSLKTVFILIGDLLSNFGIILSGDLQSISNPFRTVLFFILLWMTTYLISYWIESRKSIFGFFALTVVFVALVDTFSTYSVESSILRIMIVGFLLIGFLSVVKVASRHNTRISPSVFLTISAPLILLVVISALLATILPKQDPVWSDPVPFLQSMVNGTGEGKNGQGISKSGYDPDDSKLGGSFEQDNSLVFEAVVEEKQYWKIETKNTYTSKGWLQTSSDISTVNYPGMNLNGDETTNREDKELAELKITEVFPFVIYPYGLTKIFTDSEIFFLSEEDTGKYYTENEEGEVLLSSYEIEFEKQAYSLKKLRETSMADLQLVEENFAEYLQLPNELPIRVSELAQSVTASSESVYDKAKDIERYFGKNGFVYDRKDIAVPEEEEDYVDQFLFDTKKGYCDNYSTSMVVMLRTIGIPARWAKGFAPGKPGQKEEDKNVYRITNNEAHSWVEAYMPGVGWVAFEPTVGFAGTTSIEYDIELDLDDPEVPEIPEPEREKQEKAKAKAEKEAEINKDVNLKNILSSISLWVKAKAWWLLLITTILLIVSWSLFTNRIKWIPKVLILLYQSGVEDRTKFVKRFKVLLTQLNRFGLKRDDGETLSTYARRVDKYFGGEIMRNLTEVYEKEIYGKDKSEHDWQRLQEMWEDLINRTSN